MAGGDDADVVEALKDTAFNASVGQNRPHARATPRSMEWRRKSRRREDAVHQRCQGRYPPKGRPDTGGTRRHKTGVHTNNHSKPAHNRMNTLKGRCHRQGNRNVPVDVELEGAALLALSR